MKKSKILGIALAAAMVASISAVSVSAMDTAEVKTHFVGLIGSFNGWGNDDVEMTDEDGDGVYEGTIVIPSVTADMILDATTDPGDGIPVSRGFSGVQFKVRFDHEWTSSWGDYEEAYGRTENSQTNCCVEATEGEALTIKVKFDTTRSYDPELIPDDDSDAYKLWPVTYEKVQGETPDPVESSEEPVVESSEEPVVESSEEPVVESSEEPVVESSEEPAPVVESSEEPTTPSTGDTTSAVALVAVVIASLGAAVVMTKKAASKE